MILQFIDECGACCPKLKLSVNRTESKMAVIIGFYAFILFIYMEYSVVMTWQSMENRSAVEKYDPTKISIIIRISSIFFSKMDFTVIALTK